jgi:hypothetical protein
MTSQDDQLRDLIKNEADDLLFENLHFDTNMQVKVKQLVERERKQLENQERRTRKRWYPWFTGTAVAAALIGLFLIFAEPNFIKSPESPTVVLEPPVVLNDPGPDAPIDNPPGISNNEPRILGSYDEAGQAFGDKLRIPSYLPKGFSLHQISVTGPKEEAATEAVFSYTAGDRSFGLFVNKEDKVNMSQHFDEKVDLNGVEGYLIRGEPIQDNGGMVPNVQLHWYTDHTHFMISGLVSQEEALQIARSMEPVMNPDP